MTTWWGSPHFADAAGEVLGADDADEPALADGVRRMSVLYQGLGEAADLPLWQLDLRHHKRNAAEAQWCVRLVAVTCGR